MEDLLTAALRAVQAETTVHLWTPAQPTTFTPHVLERTFGDGRALFRFTTVNARPRWWLVRGCSSWTENNDPHDGLTPVIDAVDDVIQAIADECGGLPNMHAEYDVGEDEEEDDGYVDPVTGGPFDPIDIRYPQIDDRTGSSWAHEDWPDIAGVTLMPHPGLRAEGGRIRILAEAA